MTAPLDPARRELARANPEGVIMRVATADGRLRFAEGEPIVLTLSFSSALPDVYELGQSTYDRSGRLWTESFTFAPADRVVDPLADYFGEMRGGLGGISRRPEVLGTAPQTVQVTLNEWASFRGPGTYALFVQSTRVFSVSRGAGVPTRETREVTSENVLELEIVRDAVWASRELARVQGILDKGGDEDMLQSARRSLRFLTTPEATRAMLADLCRTRQKGDDYRFQTQAGLYGAPDRAGVISLLRAGLANPGCAVSSEFLNLLIRLEVVARNVPARSPALAQAVRKPILEALIAALPQKTDEARPLSVLTALGAVSENEAGADSAGAAALQATLAKNLGALPDEALASLLTDSWPLVRTPAVAPTLLSIAAEARPRGGRFRSISDLALERLVEVDPARARTFILAELGRGSRTAFTGATLGLLKDAELPQLEATFVAGLRALETDGVSLELHAEVFARYATQAALADAWTAYRAIPYFRVSLLAYLSKHDRAAAEGVMRGLPDIDSLMRLSRTMWSPALEEAVAGKLDAPGAYQAANLLSERGSPAAEKLLASKLEGLRGVAARREDAAAIRRALVRGASWLTPPKRLRELLAHCDEDECKRDLQRALDRWGPDGTHPVFVLWTTRPNGGVTGWLGHYDVRSTKELEARIGQLPAGTTLVWQTKPEDVDSALWTDVERWAAARKVVIAPAEAP